MDINEVTPRFTGAPEHRAAAEPRAVQTAEKSQYSSYLFWGLIIVIVILVILVAYLLLTRPTSTPPPVHEYTTVEPKKPQPEETPTITKQEAEETLTKLADEQ